MFVDILKQKVTLNRIKFVNKFMAFMTNLKEREKHSSEQTFDQLYRVPT